MNPAAVNFYVNFFIALENVENQERRRLENRYIRDHSNPFEIPNEKFIKLFRLNKEATRNLIVEIQPFMQAPQRRHKIPLHLQIFVCLNFYGHGGYQITAGEQLNLAISQPAVSRIIKEVSNCLSLHLLPRYIKFPTTDAQIRMAKERFLEALNFPNVIGSIDGTHVAIFPPKTDDPLYPAVAYLNRKGYHSINVQAIFDADLRLINVNARYPGATHDSAIWETSTIQQHLRRKYEEGRRNIWLLCDSGYPLQPWLMTPINGAPPNTPEANYNTRHCHARNISERGNGVWKGRFRCLKKDRVLHYSHANAGKIVYACAVLHNICRMYNVPEIENYEQDEDILFDENMEVHRDPVNILEEARLIRRQLVNELI